MNNLRRVMLATAILVVASPACKRKTDVESKETTTTGAEMREKAEETAKLKADHAEARHKLEGKLEAQERKATYLKQKAAKAVGKEKLNANAAIAELDARRTTAKTSLARLGDETSPAWDSAKKAAEDDIDGLEKAVDALEKTLKK